MQDLLHQLGWQLLFLPAALAVVGFMLWRGMLTQRALNRGPIRDLDLTRAEAGVGAVLGLLSVNLLGVPALMALIYRASMVEAGLRKVGLVPRWPWRDVRWALVAVPIAVVLASGTSVLVAILGQAIGSPVPTDLEAGHKTLVTLQQAVGQRPIDWPTVLQIVLLAAVLAPLIEEISFRGVMQTALLGLSGTDRRWLAILVTALVFGLIHYAAVTSWHMLPALVVLGLVFGYVYERTGSLLCCILVHAGFNAVNLGVVIFAPAG